MEIYPTKFNTLTVAISYRLVLSSCLITLASMHPSKQSFSMDDVVCLERLPTNKLEDGKLLVMAAFSTVETKRNYDAVYHKRNVIALFEVVYYSASIFLIIRKHKTLNCKYKNSRRYLCIYQ